MITKAPYLIFWISAFPDEADKMELQKNVKLYKFKKEKLPNVINLCFDKDIEPIYKVIFIDDATSIDDKNSNLFTKLLTEGRHANLDVIYCIHAITAIT